MKMLLVALVGFSTLTVEGEGQISVTETLGSPVVIESATLGFNEEATSVVTIRARASEPVGSFTARVYIYGARDRRGHRPDGVVSRALGPLGLETQSFEIPLQNYFIEDQRIKVSVGSVQAGPTPKEGLCYNFCSNERQACRQDCGVGCISRFVCKISVNSCESDCQCKATCP